MISIFQKWRKWMLSFAIMIVATTCLFAVCSRIARIESISENRIDELATINSDIDQLLSYIDKHNIEHSRINDRVYFKIPGDQFSLLQEHVCYVVHYENNKIVRIKKDKLYDGP